MKGATMNRCAVAGLASIGICWDALPSFSSACASPNGEPTSSAPLASAWNSREREIASWIRVAAMGARIAVASRPKTPPPPLRSSRPPYPPNIAPQRRHVREDADRARERRRDRADEDVAVADVRQLVREHALELVVVHELQDPRRARDRGVVGVAPVANALGESFSMR